MKKNDFEYILQLLRKYAGWNLSADNYFLIDNKIHNFVCEKGYVNSDELVQELRMGQKSILWQVIEALTFSDTYFFRDYPVFKSFEQVILPRIREINRSSKKLRIWSLGCSTGQEAYSIGISIMDKLHTASDWNISILGTDISTPAITKAQKGAYSQFEVQMGMNIRRIMKYFHKEGTEWVINQDVSDNIKFLRYNILDKLSNTEPFDIIFCRYLLGYCTPEKQRELIEKIHSYQVPGGFLYLGLNENIANIDEYYNKIDAIPCLYQAKVKNMSNNKTKQIHSDKNHKSMPTLQRPENKKRLNALDDEYKNYI